MFPLDGVRASDPENGGYGYLDWSDYQRGYHEGTDYNAGIGAMGDEGMPLLAIGRQTCVWRGSSPTGFGTHAWFRLEDGPAWLVGAHLHYAHAQAFAVEVGQTVERGETIGACGHTGTVHSHLHFVVTRETPPSWSWYGAPGMSREAVGALTWDPANVCTALEGWAAEDAVIPEERAVLEAIRRLNYPLSEVVPLLEACTTWGAGAQSLSGWVAEIGALRARLAELEAAASETTRGGDDADASR